MSAESRSPDTSCQWRAGDFALAVTAARLIQELLPELQERSCWFQEPPDGYLARNAPDMAADVACSQIPAILNPRTSRDSRPQEENPTSNESDDGANRHDQQVDSWPRNTLVVVMMWSAEWKVPRAVGLAAHSHNEVCSLPAALRIRALLRRDALECMSFFGQTYSLPLHRLEMSSDRRIVSLCVTVLV